MRRVFAALLRQPLILIGGSLALFWVVYVGVALRPRFGLPPLDTSRTVLLSGGDRTTLIQATSDGQVRTVEKTIGPVVPWKNGLVYWDNQKPCLVVLSPGQKPRTVWLHLRGRKTRLRGMVVESLMPAPDGVYLNLDGQIGFSVLYVRLPDGAARVMHNIENIKSGETTTAYATETMTNTTAIVVIVHYANRKTRTVSVANYGLVPSWDYDPVRDAVVWKDEDTVCYNSPARSWRKKMTNPYSVGVNPATGDVWVRTRGSWGSRGMVALSAAGGIERGWRWRGDTFSPDAPWELTPEQEKLARALPSYK